MTDGLVLLVAWAQYAVLVGLLLYFILRRSSRDPLAGASGVRWKIRDPQRLCLTPS